MMLPTLTDLRRALEYLDSAAVSAMLDHSRQPLLSLVLAVSADTCRYDAALYRPLAAALAGGLRAIAGDDWRTLTGELALAAVRQALAESGRLLASAS